MTWRPLTPQWSTFGSAWVAKCDLCGHVCAYWDEEDLDDDGTLGHDCEG